MAASFRDQSLTLQLDVNANALFRRYLQTMEDRRNVEWCESEALEAWASKAVGMTARLAGILTLLKDPAARTIEQHEFYCAQQLMEESSSRTCTTHSVVSDFFLRRQRLFSKRCRIS